MADAKIRKMQDKLVAAVAALGSNPVVEDIPVLADVKAFLELKGSNFKDDTSGFDEPLLRPVQWSAARVGYDECRILYGIMEDKSRPVIQVTTSNNDCTDIVWVDDEVYDAWAAYGLKEWTGNRGIDGRHLTVEEIINIATIFQQVKNFEHGSTWIHMHIRVTLEQFRDYLRYRRLENEENEAAYNADMQKRMKGGYRPTTISLDGRPMESFNHPYQHRFYLDVPYFSKEYHDEKREAIDADRSLIAVYAAEEKKLQKNLTGIFRKQARPEFITERVLKIFEDLGY